MSKKLLNIVLLLSFLAIPFGYIYKGFLAQLAGLRSWPRVSLLLVPVAAVLAYAMGVILGRKSGKTQKFANIILYFLIPCTFALTWLVAKDTLDLVILSVPSLLRHVAIRGGLNCFALLFLNESAIRFSLNEHEINRRNRLCIGGCAKGEIRYIHAAKNHEIWRIQQQKSGLAFAVSGFLILQQSFTSFRPDWRCLGIAVVLACLGFCRFGAFEESA